MRASSPSPAEEPTTTTTTSDVRPSYYGIPPIKAPHWRWLVINYFFAGSLAGGAFAIATLADLFSRDRALVRAGRYLSLAAVVVSPVLLVLDLGRPDRAHHMFRIVKLRSPMSLGSWALLLLGLCSGPVGLLQLLADLTGRELLRGTRRALSLVGLPFSLFVAGYTGVLLAATSVPLWARSALLLGPTFICSAFSNSLAALTLLLRVSGRERASTAAALGRAESIALAGEIALVLASLARLGELRRPLTLGRWGRIFWPVSFGGGMLLPLGLQLSAGRSRRGQATGRRALAAALALSGGYTFRMLLILAGRDSAHSPQDYFSYTRRLDGDETGTGGTR